MKILCIFALLLLMSLPCLGQYGSGQGSYGTIGNGSSGSGAGGIGITTNQYFVSVYGSDANTGTSWQSAWLTLSNAFLRVTNGQTAVSIVNLDYGIYWCSNTLLDCYNCTIIGKSRGQIQDVVPASNPTGMNLAEPNNCTIIALDTLSGVCLGDNSGLEHLVIFQSAGGHLPLCTIGSASGSGDPNYTNYPTITTTNAFVRDCNVYGWNTHACLFDSPTNIFITMENDNVWTRKTGDCITTAALNTEFINSPSNTLILNNVNLLHDPVTGVANGTLDSSLVWNSSGYLTVNGGYIRQTKGALNDAGIYIGGTNVVANLAPSTIFGDANHADVVLTSTANNVIVNVRSGINPNLVTNLGTGNTINFAPAFGLAQPNVISNLIVSGGYWTNTNAFTGVLTINGSSLDSVTGDPGMNMTNLITAEWMNATSSLAVAGIIPWTAVFRMAPNDYVIATNFSSGTATSTIKSSSFRP